MFNNFSRYVYVLKIVPSSYYFANNLVIELQKVVPRAEKNNLILLQKSDRRIEKITSGGPKFVPSPSMKDKMGRLCSTHWKTSDRQKYFMENIK
jgi:hypothetical protein